MRVKSRWRAKDKERSLEEVAGAVGFIAWRIGANGCLHLENEGFQTDTQLQRLDVVSEFTAFAIHLTDRLTIERLTLEQRHEFMTALALKCAKHYHDSKVENAGPGNYQQEFIDLLNERMEAYAEFAFVDSEPSFNMRRYFGDRVTDVMGPKDRKWVTQQVMDIEAPEVIETLAKALRNLMPPDDETPRS
ncbi:MAG: hypothetical protein JSW10_05585 [Pseudomonadota bacterium]|nr:MAG: hypothetical protein JSW10_05585 [Pseudomonadota bacterium]